MRSQAWLRCWIFLFVATCFVGGIARAQVYAPQPPAALPGSAAVAPAPQILSAAPIPSTGNPFQNQLRPRPTSAATRLDDRVVPASFDQPIGESAGPAAASLTPAASASAPLTEINFPAAPPVVGASAEPPQPLSGLALLAQRSVDSTGANPEHPLAPVIRWTEDALQQMQALRDYSGTFSKREWVDGRLQEQQVLYVKVRQHPFSVYLQFLAPNDVRGQEALYVVGRNGGNLLAHPVGIKQALVGTISIAPDSPQAMEGNRHPITDFGVRRLLERYREGAIMDAQYGECEVQIIENARVNNRTCVCIDVVHPQPRKEFRFHRSRLYIDQQWNIPVRCEGYDWPKRPGDQPQLTEEYTYQGLRLNVGLSDADFDPNNPQYRFN